MSLNYTNIPSKFISEIIGTFILVNVILVVTSKTTNTAQNCAIPIGIALAVGVYMFGDISGGHFNPIVSLVAFFNNKGSVIIILVLFIIAQCIGGFAALQWHKNIKI